MPDWSLATARADEERSLDDTLAKALRPDPALTVVQWADTHRMISGRAASEPGRWRTARTPYLAEIMLHLSAQSPVRRVVVQKAAQVGFTEAAMNWLGYVIDQAPGPFLFVQPTVELAKRLSRQRLEPSIQETPVLRDRVRQARSRDAGNTVLLKEFPGGLVVLTGANSAAGLRSLSARYICFDEVDGYPGDVEGEGDPLGLAEARARTFPRRKVLILSTPKVAGMSRIEREYQATDQRRFFVPCPHCATMQPLEFPRLRWEATKPETVRYVCAACEAPILEASKTQMLAAGEWRPTAPSADPAVVGYHLSALYAPLGWMSWLEIARAAEEATRDPTKLKNFDNTILGEAFAERGDAPDWRQLRERQTAAPLGVVPTGALFLTCGVDVQADRLEASVWGWGRGRRSWLVDHRVIDGEVAREEPWAALSELVARTWPGGSAGHLAMPLARVAVDAGFATTQVHAWARRQPTGRVVLVRGGPPAVALVSLPRIVDAVEAGPSSRRRHRRALRVWQVDGHAIKLETYGWLYLDAPEDGVSFPAGWISLPAVGDEFLRQFVAEQLVRKVVKGREVRTWIKVYNRNEALDCRVYARAAAHLAGLDRFTEAEWAGLEAPFAAPPPVASPPPAPAARAAAAPAAPAGPSAGLVPPPGGPAAEVKWRPSRFWAGRPRQR